MLRSSYSSSRLLFKSGVLLSQSKRLPAAVVDVLTTRRTLSSSSSTTPLLRRPPSRQEKPSADRKWRTHAIPLQYGDYSDDGNDVVNLRGPHDPSKGGSYNWQEEEMKLAERVQEIQHKEDAQKKKWIENAKPPMRVSTIDERGRAYGRGGRKSASARVWIQPGMGQVVVNKRDFVDYFDRLSDRAHVLKPLAATETCGKFDVTATVKGGGLTGQAGALRHGLARALNNYNPDEYRPPLKYLGYLTRDPRKVERKKIGHLKARKKPQWVKR